MAKYYVTLNDEKIAEIKKNLKLYGIREAGRQSQVSYYTAWAVSKGLYDNNQPLQVTDRMLSRCPITGW